MADDQITQELDEGLVAPPVETVEGVEDAVTESVEEVHDRLDEVLNRLDDLHRKVDELRRTEHREERREEEHHDEHEEHREEEHHEHREEEHHSLEPESELPPPIDVVVEEPKEVKPKRKASGGFRSRRRRRG